MLYLHSFKTSGESPNQYLLTFLSFLRKPSLFLITTLAFIPAATAQNNSGPIVNALRATMNHQLATGAAVNSVLTQQNLASVVARSIQVDIPINNEVNLDELPAISTVDGKPFDVAGAVVLRTEQDGDNVVLVIDHNQDNAVLNWDTFNIGENGIVDFQQTGPSSITLNRVVKGIPSQIRGAIKANGRIYLINQNGIVFGENSQVNVGGLIASTLDINEEVFNEGILSAINNQEAAFEDIPFLVPQLDANGNEVLQPKLDSSGQVVLDENNDPVMEPVWIAGETGDLVVEENSNITSDRIVLIAPNVKNSGELISPDGQIILAAGQKVYLQASDDPSLRGLLVEVDNGGKVRNLGDIIADRGNATLIGLSVNQENRITSTTTTSSNGSVRLLARDTVNVTNLAGDITIDATETGEVVFGQDSVTEILAELDSTNLAIDDQTQFKSSVEVMGANVVLKTNSLIEAKGGSVDIQAVENPFRARTNSGIPIAKNTSSVVLEDGAKIDVSGNDATLDMSRNNLNVELRGNELADLPLQRDGALRGESVVIDVRRADDFQLGNISGNLASVQRGVGERTSTGGDIKIRSEGSIEILSGSELDVSGGVINYLAGDIQTTLLRAGSQVIDIHDADPDRIYDGVDSITSNFEPGYSDGMDAGTVQLSGRTIVADGSLTGNTIASRRQRTEANRPQGGRLIIGQTDPTIEADFEAPNITLGDVNLLQTAGSYDSADLAGFENQLVLSNQFLVSGGFTRAELNSNGTITITDGSVLNLQPNSLISVQAKRVNVNRSITTQSGDLNFSAVNTNASFNISSDRSGISVADDVVLDVSGNWTNDRTGISLNTPTSAVMLDGGTINLSANTEGSEVLLGDRVGLLTLGGAQITRGQELLLGKGGDVTLSLGNQNIDLSIGQDLVILGHGPAGGGNLTLNTNGVSIENISAEQWAAGQTVAAGGTVTLPDFLFSDFGFNGITVTSNQGDVIVQSGTNIQSSTSSLFLPTDAFSTASSTLSALFQNSSSSNLLNARSSGLVSDYASSAQSVVPWLKSDNFTGLAPEFARNPQTITLAVVDNNRSLQAPRDLVLSAGSNFVADAESVIDINNESGGLVHLNGNLIAPASDVTVSLRRKSTQLFDQTHAVVIGDQANIDLSGKVISLPDSTQLGKQRGKVVDAGNLTISSSGYIIAQQGAQVDLSGTSAVFDVTGGISQREESRQVVTGRAGSISYAAAEGIVDNSSYDLSAANDSAYGGSMRYELNRNRGGTVGAVGNSFLNGDLEVTISQASNNSFVGYSAGDVIDNSRNGKLELSADNLAATGADQLAINTDNQSGAVTFVGDVDLSLRRDIVVDTSNISSDGGNISLNAHYVAIGADGASTRTLNNTDDGELTINANLIDLIGFSLVDNISTLNLNSSGDLRMRGVGNQILGSLSMNGDVNITADQIYPTTLTDFTLDAGNIGTVNINPGDSAGGLVLSAAGRLTLKAGDINQGGTIKAPFGEVVFDASNNLTIADGSLTSVSGDGQTVLLGRTENGTNWIYDRNTNVIYSSDQQNLTQKRIVLNGDNVVTEDGAVIELTGGGDTLAYEFIPGPGGSRDFLLAENAENVFAVIPDLGSDFAAFDSQEFSGWDLSAAESVYLSGGGGLEAGTYVKLPARYALLPGAYLVESVDGFDNAPLGDSLQFTNGVLVSGKEVVAGTNIQETNTSGYIIREGDYVNQLSEFDINSGDELVSTISAANDFQLPRLNQDAGALAIQGQNNVELNGQLLASASDSARGALVDITANNIQVVESKSGNSSVVELLADNLNGLGAESILIGGTREFTVDGTKINVTADEVAVTDGVNLEGREVVVIAKDQVALQDGSQLTSTGNISGEREILLLDGDSALARVSASDQVAIQRTNTNGTANLILSSGAAVNSENSITLDSSGDIQLDGIINNIDGGALALGGSDINIGDVTGVSGLILDDAKLADLAGQDLSLRSDKEIQFFGTAELNQTNLEIISSGFVADQVSGADVTINAESVTLGNEFGQDVAVDIPNGNARIAINTNELQLNQGEFNIQGFDTIDANVAGDVVGNREVTLSVNGDLNLNTNRLTTTTGSDLTLSVKGDIRIDELVAVNDVADLNSIAGRLKVDASTIEINTDVAMPVGIIELSSTGDVVLGTNSNLDVSGLAIDVLGERQINLPGGRLSIESTSGNVLQQSGSVVDVRSGGGDSQAGSIEISATQGDVSFSGSLLGSDDGISANEVGASISIDAKTINQSLVTTNTNTFSSLNSTLNAGGFTATRDIRLLEGDIVIEAGDIIRANDIRITTEGANNTSGNITVNGNLANSSDIDGGNIAIIAKDNLTINNGAVVSSVSGDGSESGYVSLQSAVGSIGINNGSSINAGENGVVHIRAQRNATNNEVNLSDLSGGFTAADIYIEAVGITNNISNIGGGEIASIQTETDAFMANANAIETRLGVAADDRFKLQPGVEIRNNGDITLNSDWDLSTWRFDGVPGVLSIRATGDININADLSDGVDFSPGQVFPPTPDTLLARSDDAWSYNLLAGAAVFNGEYSSDVLRVDPASSSNLTIAGGNIVRTGTGDISIIAANDVITSDAVVYTLGKNSGQNLDKRAAGTNLDPSKLIPTGGGDIQIVAGNNIIGSDDSSDLTDLFVEWFKSQGFIDEKRNPFTGGFDNVNEDAGTWIDFANFDQGVAAFGGGDVDISAGNDIIRLSISAPTNVASDYEDQSVRRVGNGDITVAAGGDIEGGIIFIGDGAANIRSDGNITTGRIRDSNELDTVVAQMGGTVSLQARDEVRVEAIYNPTLVGAQAVDPIFSTYTDESLTEVVSLSGNVYLDTASDIDNLTNNSFSDTSGFRFLPADLSLQSISGDIEIDEGSLTQFPNAEGGLLLYADNSINHSGVLISSKLRPNNPPTVNNQANNPTDLRARLRTGVIDNNAVNDQIPTLVVANRGDINELNITTAEETRIFAGRDINNLTFRGQNLSESDFTRVQAGRDIVLTDDTEVISIGGPGRLEVLAGRNIDLGPSVGIETSGDLVRPELADSGADIYTLAGIGDNGPQYQDFFNQYFSEDGTYRQNYLDFINAKFNGDQNAISNFQAQSSEQQWAEIRDDFIPYIYDAYYGELVAAGRDLENGFGRGFQAIDVLFPESQFNRVDAYDPDKLSLKLPGETNQDYFARLAELSDYDGDLSLFFSKVYSLDGGDINILVPGGFVNAGLAAPPANAPNKAPGELGVVAQSVGDIRTSSRGNFQVNQSRVSTLLGGDIVMWSSTGDIDAGRGSKTAVSAPEPIISVTPTGEIIVDLSNTVSGSGIRAVVVDPSVEPGNVDLIAPNGIVNAGDAGIATSGNLNIAARLVVGADNIQVGGLAVGVPTASTGGLSTGGLSGVSNAAAANQAAQNTASDESLSDSDQAVEEAPQLSFISVEILGFGYDDIEEEEQDDEESAEVSLKDEQQPDTKQSDPDLVTQL